jgi:hypothetical protein
MTGRVDVVLDVVDDLDGAGAVDVISTLVESG